MSTAKEYLDFLFQQNPEFFSQPPEPSTLTEEDLHWMEEQLGYSLPAQFRAFLTCYQLAEIMVYLTFCGELAASLYYSFSKEKHGYLPSDNTDFVVVDFKWYPMLGTSGADYLTQFKHDELCECWLTAGFIHIGDFYMESYYVFYDLLTEKVCYIHNEEIMESPVDWDDRDNIRHFMLNHASILCNEWNDFLHLVCLGEPYDEDNMLFLEEAIETDDIAN